MKTITSLMVNLSIAAVFGLVTFLFLYQTVSAQTYTWTGDDVELEGWMWSSTIGWISVSCATGSQTGTDICSTSDYGLTINNSTGRVNGYAWSSNVGWIKFGGVNGCPDGLCNARIVENGADLEFRGWARVCSVFASGCSGSLASSLARGGYDGWISLSCANANECSKSNYQPTLGNGSFNDNAYVWGNEIVGWATLSRVIFTPPCRVTTYCDGDDIVTTDAWCRETRVTCTNGCDPGPPAQCIPDEPKVTTFEPDATVVRVGDTIEVEINVSDVVTSCVVKTIEGDSPTFTQSGGAVTVTWTSPALTGATKFTLECDGVELGEFTVQVIPISSEI